MLASLRDNIEYKLLALGFAIALHFYVASQVNPHATRTLSVPLTVQNLPPGLLWKDKTPPLISVTLDGPADALSRLPDAQVVPTVDLSHARAGKNVNLPVQLSPLPGGQAALDNEDVQPPVVSVTLEPKTRRRLSITAFDPGAPPAGYLFQTPVVTPQRAAVEGARSAVDTVQQLVVKADAGDAVGTVDDDFPIVALDAQHAQVPDITITPAQAHVHIAMLPAPAAKTLIISPAVTGTPPFPYAVTQITVSPPVITVMGRPNRLGQIGTVMTTPIDLSGATASLTRTVACVAPPGTTLSGTGRVTVTVRIVTQQPLVPPASAPAPAASPAPPVVVPAAH